MVSVGLTPTGPHSRWREVRLHPRATACYVCESIRRALELDRACVEHEHGVAKRRLVGEVGGDDGCHGSSPFGENFAKSNSFVGVESG